MTLSYTVQYAVGVANFSRADEHVQLLLYVMEYTPTLCIRSLAHALQWYTWFICLNWMHAWTVRTSLFFPKSLGTRLETYLANVSISCSIPPLATTSWYIAPLFLNSFIRRNWSFFSLLYSWLCPWSKKREPAADVWPLARLGGPQGLLWLCIPCRSDLVEWSGQGGDGNPHQRERSQLFQDVPSLQGCCHAEGWWGTVCIAGKFGGN